MVGRGVLGDVTRVELCSSAQEQFDVFCTMSLVPLGQLYGSKLCAALDRQHPRDLFDVKLLFENEGLNVEIKEGLLFGLLISNRPTHEIFAPNLIDQRVAFENQFEGMSAYDFTYADNRERLLKAVMASLNEYDRSLLIGFNRLEADWSIYPYQDFPSVKRKILNLNKFKRNDPDNYEKHLNRLERQLER
jgi:hypothetical protein